MLARNAEGKSRDAFACDHLNFSSPVETGTAAAASSVYWKTEPAVDAVIKGGGFSTGIIT